MNGLPEFGPPEDYSGGAGDAEPGTDFPEIEIPEWAPLEPLPSAEMLLATFSGAQPVTAGDILNPAFDLVECQRDYRLAVEVLADTEASSTELRAAATMLVTAHADIDMLVTVIDDVVLTRMMQRHRTVARAPLPTQAPPGQLPQLPIHTESIGEIAAKMADLWERAVSTGADTDPMATACAAKHQLAELCAGYDDLAGEVESGRRLFPGM
ncbi:hypothetical protein [Nocardia vaccinii]|uniref:hypothetical protein n=1 Tax=Nocardia vaccinii TaxID=1822 RepID=UPI0012F4C206|nr:hypothetical protein [Nocardia vaccinii]